jgi:LmbE family N-acetylglucosaminyl deacetylase/glycosyltransferase involved in cell wall biosynthesis
LNYSVAAGRSGSDAPGTAPVYEIMSLTMPPHEKELIPFEPTPLRGERLLVIAPHPDDEIIGCGGLIALHTSEKRAVRVVIVTDGTEAARNDDTADYRQRREEETERGLSFVGSPETKFLRFPDRQVLASLEAIAAALAAEIDSFAPDLIAVPAPTEIHPDHRGVCRAFLQALRASAASSPLTRVAFYEVSRPINPNVLVDITSVAIEKFEGIEAHQSQSELRRYTSFARGLNAYRSMTLPAAVEFAEAYSVIPRDELRRMRWEEVSRLTGTAPTIDLVEEIAPVTVLVRTRNRPHLLREALDSIERGSHPASIIVVNDGGESPAELLAGKPAVTLIDLSPAVGRSEAMNRAVAAAKTKLIAFLDDDDLYDVDHLETLLRVASRERHVAFYSDAVHTFWSRNEAGEWELRDRMELFGFDFDRDLLLLDNYIPLNTVLTRRDEFLAAGGFSPDLDLFEDWDFLLRLSRRGEFLHIPRLTCEVRHYGGGDSLLLATTSDRSRIARGKSAIWNRHRDHLTDDALSHGLEAHKRRIEKAASAAAEEKGRASHLLFDVRRLERDKRILLEQVEQAGSEQANLRDKLAAAEHSVASGDEYRRRLEQALKEQSQFIDQAHATIEEMHRQLAESATTVAERDELNGRLFAEIERLNSLLTSIYGSRSWKLHQMFEKLRGRG